MFDLYSWMMMIVDKTFTADMVMSRVGQDTDVFRNDGSDENSADLNDFFVLEEDHQHD